MPDCSAVCLMTFRAGAASCPPGMDMVTVMDMAMDTDDTESMGNMDDTDIMVHMESMGVIIGAMV